jgi:protein-glutamine gamma-glutamyltransferase
MILIDNQSSVDIGTLPLSELERAIALQKLHSPETYRYPAADALLFEQRMRSRIVDSAMALNASGIRFSTFENSQCNEKYWVLNAQGGFQLRGGVAPSTAIRDIYMHGWMYAMECATAMVVVLYQAVVESIGERPFNLYFRDLLLYDWHYDSDLHLQSKDNLNEAYPGDVLYFKNPDHAPETPQWQGENTILLPNGLHYGHGAGIRTAEGIIAGLNTKRRPGSQISAYLTNRVVYPDFEHLRKLSGVIGRIGAHVYLHNW